MRQVRGVEKQYSQALNSWMGHHKEEIITVTRDSPQVVRAPHQALLPDIMPWEQELPDCLALNPILLTSGRPSRLWEIETALKWSISSEINPEYSLEGLMLKLKLQYFWPSDANK